MPKRKRVYSNEKTVLLAVAVVVFSENFSDGAFNSVGGYAEEEEKQHGEGCLLIHSDEPQHKRKPSNPRRYVQHQTNDSPHGVTG
jgi:hypothetical protein